MNPTVAILGMLLLATVHAQDTDQARNLIPPNPTGTAPGRYQLIAGTIASGPDATPVMMRLDTATGRVWIFTRSQYPIAGSDATVQTEGWIITTESYTQAMAHSQALAETIHAEQAVKPTPTAAHPTATP